MTSQVPSIVYKGRSLGILVVVTAQLLVGTIHVASGIWLLGYELTAQASPNFAYDVYTLTFGALTLVFAGLVWQQKKLGLIGTITVAVFVIAADALTLLDLPSIPGIPKVAGFAEIAYSLLIVLYLLQTGVRSRFK
jgi:hypothetical protein